MLSLTIRLEGRSLHLVRHLADCEVCGTTSTHTRIEPSLFLYSEIARVVQSDAAAFAGFREMAEDSGLFHDSRRLPDAQVLEHVAWLLETDRLIAIECVRLWESVPVADAPERPRETPRRRRAAPVEEPKTWVEIELVDDAGKPVANRKYRIKVPSGAVEEGTLDAKGRARIEGIDPGMCEITFPDIDAKEWKRA